MDLDEKLIVCPICRYLVCPSTQVAVTDCVESYVRNKNECPCCRTPCTVKEIAELKFLETVPTTGGFCPGNEHAHILHKLVELNLDLEKTFSALQDSKERYEKFLSDISDHLKEYNHRVYTSFEEVKTPFKSPASIIEADRDKVFRPCCPSCKDFSEWNSYLNCMTPGRRIKLFFPAEQTLRELENEVVPLLDFQKAHADGRLYLPVTTDHALKLETIPDWIAIVGSGYIGLEFSDVYTALGSEVTFIEALDQLMPGFDPEISKLAQRVLIIPRHIDYYTGVFATKITPARDGKPVTIELTDAKTKEPKDTLEVDAALIATGRAPFTEGLGLENIDVVTQRGFVPVDERMRVTDANGNLVPHLYCIGDANGKMMLAHAASAQGISVVEQVTGRDHVLNHLSIPAACFTHPEISMVGLTEPQAREKGEKEGFEVTIAKTSFKANTKALAENEAEGLAKVIFLYLYTKVKSQVTSKVKKPVAA
ncbi:hypothetical protein PIB30_041303 [Stylosanthes scabra]|uniref:Dihydrolipoyl dehydrogenase n=1 Tax=Stylosanthes scabra TaxID=79078 RepID=A0ABU6QE94_9FABA|nr:hypothetical protein [Stylosanthes scabra]